MLAKIQTAAVMGISAVPVTVEVDLAAGLPGVTIVGLPDAAIRESKDRIKAALRNTQFAWPQNRIVVNLAPADVRKEGSAFDFPIALGLLAASGQLEPENFRDLVALGELALDGTLRPVPGALCVALSLKGKGKHLLLPMENAPEAALVAGLPVYPVGHLHQAMAFLKGAEKLEPLQSNGQAYLKSAPLEGPDFAEVKGQTLAKRAVEVAVAGGHNLILIGPPGAGKTMLAQRIPTIFPEMTLEEALEVTLIYSVLGLNSVQNPLIAARPFRAAHPSISDAGLIGGGMIPQPGELSMAHHGVLFLDELPEFSRSVLESLRQPLEDGTVTVARVHGKVTLPARCMLVASMNPCPCGLAGDPAKNCLCTPSQIHRYRSKISAPLLDRIDLHLEVPAVSFNELIGDGQAESSAAVRQRVERARAIQRQRFQSEPKVFCNAHMRSRHLRRWCRLPPEGRDLLRQAVQALGLSARAYDRILKVSRTIADLAGSEEIQVPHLAEAVQYRALDRSNY